METVANPPEMANEMILETFRDVIRIDQGQIKTHLDQVVRETVEQTLNALPDAEADALCGAKRYQRSPDRVDTRAGSYDRKLLTKAGEVTRTVPRLRKLPFETQIIERYQRRESSVEEARIEMDLAGVTMPGNAISTASTFVTVALLQQGTDMVSILPTAVAEMFVRRGMLRILPVKLRSMSQTIGIVTRKGGQLSGAGEALVRLLRERSAL